MADEPNTLHSPEPSWGGEDVDAAVQNAEAGTRTEGVHRPAAPGETAADSRLEQLREVAPTPDAEDADTPPEAPGSE